MKRRILIMSTTMLSVAALLPMVGRAQITTGSDGSDGAFNPTANIVINMADHANGIYQYSSVNIPSGVTVTFIPNANNTPVYWLVQSNVVINGTVDVSAQPPSGLNGGAGGPGGWAGGSGFGSGTSGQGPGGGTNGSNGSYNYGNVFLIPLLGGSGGGGIGGTGASGGGGAILIAVSTSMVVNGAILAKASGGASFGSGGAVRLVASQISGNGQIRCDVNNICLGRIRFDTYDDEFAGSVSGQFTQGSQFVIIPTVGQLPQLTVTSVGGVPVSASPTGVLSTPDAVISAQQNNPIPIVVSCVNLPLNSAITVSVNPMNASPVSAVGYNNTGTQASSTATVSLNMPRGGGLIYATAITKN
jgi:hypothetical protein